MNKLSRVSLEFRKHVLGEEVYRLDFRSSFDNHE